MEYMIMSLEDANKVAKKDAIVLVAKQDLEESDCNVAFSKKRFGECKNILEEAKIIAKVCDEFSAQLMAFSETQADIINHSNKGKLTTMLFSKLE